MLLLYFDPEKEIVIQLDTSNRGLVIALLQEGKTVAFALKSLAETEQQYANIEQELLAVVFGCEYFQIYIYGCAFQVESYHKPLKMINLKNLITTSSCLQQILFHFQGYDMTIVYHPGKQ